MSLQRIQINRKIQDISGSAITGATVTVSTLPENGTAVIYLNETGTALISQPLISDSEGDINGWVELGDYSIFIQSSSGSVNSRFYASHPKQSYLQTYGNQDLPLTVKANSSQSGNILEIKDSSDSNIASVGTTGIISSPTISSLDSTLSGFQGTINTTYGLATALQGSANSLQTSAGSVQTYLSNVSGTANNMFETVSNVSGTVTTTHPSRLGTIEANNWVTTSRIEDGAVTRVKLNGTVDPQIELLATQTFTSSTNYILPANAKNILVEFVGAGGGGGGGGKEPSTYVLTVYGGGGGQGGPLGREMITRAELSGTVTVTVGAGGAGGAGATTDSYTGSDGSAGGWSQFGPLYWPGGRSTYSGFWGYGAQAQTVLKIRYGYGAWGETTPGATTQMQGYRGFRGAGGGGGGTGMTHMVNSTAGGTGGKGFDVPSNVWPTDTNPNPYDSGQGGATGAAGDGGNGGDVWNGSGWVSGAGGNGVFPGGGGGGGGAGSGQYPAYANGGTGGSGANARIRIWVFG